MSYSYIKSVFPNFENSNKVYDETLYTNINSSLYSEVNIQQVKPLEYYNKEDNRGNTFNLSSDKLLENLTNVNQDETVTFQSQYSEQQTPTISKTQFVESQEFDCDTHVKHILDCKQCRMLAIKHLSIESDKYRNEEMMELASYVIFGMFILLLIDSLKKDK